MVNSGTLGDMFSRFSRRKSDDNEVISKSLLLSRPERDFARHRIVKLSGIHGIGIPVQKLVQLRFELLNGFLICKLSDVLRVHPI